MMSGKRRTARAGAEGPPVSLVCRRLGKVYGPVRPPRRRPVLDQLIATILSQNTSDANSHAAFDSLKRRFGHWEAVRQASLDEVVGAIRRAGLANQKAPRIQTILDEIHGRWGRLSLDFLHHMSAAEGMALLRQFPGVGPKTAACVLLFACGKPVLPVDTHVHRVSRRLGLIDPHIDAAKAHEQLAQLVPPQRVLEFHIQLIRHGRQICLARAPRCGHCVLQDRCPEGQWGE